MVRLVLAVCAIWAAIIGFTVISKLDGQANIATPNGVMITVDGKFVGNFTSITFTSGNGVTWAYQPNGASIALQAGVNTATIVNKNILQSGACTFLNSTNGTAAYTVSLGPVCQALTAYTAGQRFWLQTDTPCPISASQSGCTLNIDTVGIRNIKQADGLTDPLFGQFDFKKGVPIRYDGAVFRIEWQH